MEEMPSKIVGRIPGRTPGVISEESLGILEGAIEIKPLEVSWKKYVETYGKEWSVTKDEK